jgi:hypothetical protein
MAVESSCPLPTFLGPLFWDTDPDRIDTQTHRDFVIGRILSAGTLDSIRWARSPPPGRRIWEGGHGFVIHAKVLPEAQAACLRILAPWEPRVSQGTPAGS